MHSTVSGRRLAAALLCLVPFAAAAARDAAIPPDVSARALEMLKRSIGFKTAEGEGQVPAYAEYLAGELKAAGFAAEDIEITRHGERETRAIWRKRAQLEPSCQLLSSWRKQTCGTRSQGGIQQSPAAAIRPGAPTFTAAFSLSKTAW